MIRRPKRQSEHERHERYLDRVEHKLDQLLERTKRMAISQEQFDTDLAALLAAETANSAAMVDLIAAVDASLESKADLTAEDEEVQTAAAVAAGTAKTVADELAKLAPPQTP